MSYSVSHYCKSSGRDRDGIMLPSSATHKLLLPILKGVNISHVVPLVRNNNKMNPFTGSSSWILFFFVNQNALRRFMLEEKDCVAARVYR